MTIENPTVPLSPGVTGQTLIPAAYEQRPLTSRRAGAMSGPAFGSSDAPIGPPSMDAATLAERRKEGGETAD
jgi:hypothetical protein